LTKQHRSMRTRRSLPCAQIQPHKTMKLLVAAFATWISFALSTSCQLILLPGESFTFEFRDFSFEGSSELGVPGTTRIHFTLPPGLPSPSAWRVDVFENR